jgi:predicted phosphodiesterase
MVGAHPTSSEPTLPIAVLSDIHGNRQALDAVLQAARQAGARSWWCVGDLVGYGADPAHTLRVATTEAERCIGGNHDLAVAGRVPVGLFSSAAREAIEWTRATLGRPGRDRLDRLEAVDLDGDVPLFHGSPRDPVWEYVTELGQARAALEDRRVALTIIGHTHAPFAWRLTPDGAMQARGAAIDAPMALEPGRWLVNPGSVGQPRDGDARAAWLLYDAEEGTIHFRRTPYDVAGAQNAILQAGLPSSLAHRLAEGR